MERYSKSSRILFWIIHIIWGFPTFLVGSVIALYMLAQGNKATSFGYGVYFTSSKMSSCGFSIGPFFVIAEDSVDSKSLLAHEHGHALQTLWWGPLMLFVISIPSAIRFIYRDIVQKMMYNRLAKNKITVQQYASWRANFPDYDSIWFEGQATRLGEKYIL